jgi:hypoxanthine phosphoribosyltransferase
MTKTKIFITWQDIDYIVGELERQIRREGLIFDGIYGIPRGGLILAVMLSHRLKLTLLDKCDENCLLVDDISDKGDTLQKYKGKRIACMYSSLWTKVLPDYFARMKWSKDTWLVFPYEVEENEGD